MDFFLAVLLHTRHSLTTDVPPVRVGEGSGNPGIVSRYAELWWLRKRRDAVDSLSNAKMLKGKNSVPLWGDCWDCCGFGTQTYETSVAGSIESTIHANFFFLSWHRFMKPIHTS